MCGKYCTAPLIQMKLLLLAKFFIIFTEIIDITIHYPQQIHIYSYLR